MTRYILLALFLCALALAAFSSTRAQTAPPIGNTAHRCVSGESRASQGNCSGGGTPAPTPPPTALQFAQTPAHSSVACSTTNTTPAITQPAAGDLIIIYVLSSTSGAFSTPSGFTAQPAATNGSLVFGEFYKIASGNEGGTFSVVDSSATGRCDFFVADVINESQTLPFDQHNANLSTFNAFAGPFASNALTPTNTGELAIALLNTGTTGQSVSSFSPSNMTDYGDSGDFSNHLFSPTTLLTTSPFTASMNMASANANANQIEVLDLINPVGAGGPTPTPSPIPAQRATLDCAPPVSPYANPDAQCGNGVILSAYEFTAQGTNSCTWGNPYFTAASQVEFLNSDYTTLNSCASSFNFMNTYLSMTDYWGGSGASLPSYSQRVFEGQASDEPVLYHYADPARLSATPVSSTSCLVSWGTDYFDTAGNGQYILYNAATNAKITSATGGGANTTMSFLHSTTGTNYYYVNYVAVNTTIASNIASGQQTVTPASGTNLWWNTYVLVCNGNAGNPAGCGSDAEVVRVNNVNSTTAPTTFSATFTNAHTCPCLVYAEVPYSSIDPLDGISSVNSATMPNVPYIGYNGFYPGTRLGTTANGQGFTAPSCTTAAPGSTAVLSGYNAAPSPNPVPPSILGDTATPAPGTAVSPNLSVLETTTSQLAPVAFYCYSNYCQSWTQVASQSWTQSSTAYASTTKWSLTAGTVSSISGNSFGYPTPMVFEVCASGSVPPWPSHNCTPPFVGTQSENERMAKGEGHHDTGRWKATCSPRAMQEQTDESDGVFGVGNDPQWGIGQGLLTSPPRTVNEMVRADDYGSMPSAVDVPIANTTSGDPFIPNGSNDTFCQYTQAIEVFGNREAAGGWREFTHVGIVETPQAMKNIIANSSQLVDIVDGFVYTANGTLNASSMGTAWYNQAGTPLAEVMNGISSVVHPRQDTTVPNIFSQRYNAFALYLIIKDDQNRDGHQRMSFRDVYSGNVTSNGGGCTAGCLDPIYYVPLGHPLTAQSSSIGPCGDVFTSGCSFAASSGDWNATDGMYERHFVHGDVYYCPPTGGLNQTNCNGKVITLPAPESLLGASTGNIDNAQSGTRQWSAPMSSFTAASNTGYIFTYYAPSAVTWVGSATASGACAASLSTGTLSAAPQAGDVVVLSVKQNGNGTAATVASTGFSQATAPTTGTVWDQTILYKVAGSSEPTSYTYTDSLATNQCASALMVVRNADQTAPIDAASIATGGIATTTLTSPSLTPGQSGDLGLGLLGSNTSQTLSTYSPGTATNAASYGTWSDHIFYEPNLIPSSYSMSMTMTTTNGGTYHPLEALVLVKPAANTSTATIDGVPVFTACDWFDTDLSQPTSCSPYATNVPDPNSATILNYINANLCNPCTFNVSVAAGSVNVNSHVNVFATGEANVNNYSFTSGNCAYGCSNTPWNDNPGTGPSGYPGCTSNCLLKIPWASDGLSHVPHPFEESNQDGPSPYNCSNAQERHDEVLNTTSHIAYESYIDSTCSFTGSAWQTASVATYNLNHSYDSQKSNGTDAAGIPHLATSLWGDDAALSTINHSFWITIPGSDNNAIASSNWVTPATHAGGSGHCNNACTWVLPMGARLLLKSSQYNCDTQQPVGSYPQANKVCHALEKYGIIIVDHGGGGPSCSSGPTGSCTAVSGQFTTYAYEDINGNNPWTNTGDLGHLSTIPINATYWTIMTLGTIH